MDKLTFNNYQSCFMFIDKDVVKNYSKLSKLCKGHDMMVFTESKV